MTTIRYFIPEDGDLETQPNVFLAPKPRHAGAPPSLGQVKDAFPLPGQYHFRFKAPLTPGGDREKGAMSVWMDLLDERDPVPTWKNGIVVKVTRISMEDDDEEDDYDDHHQDHNPAPPQRSPAPAPLQPSKAPPSHSNSMASVGSAASIDDLFGSPPPSVPVAASGSGGSLLDFNDHAAASASTAPAHADFLGMSAPPQQQHHRVPPAPSSGGYPNNPNLYGSQTQPPPQQQFNTGYSQQQQHGGAFGGLGTPWS